MLSALFSAMVEHINSQKCFSAVFLFSLAYWWYNVWDNKLTNHNFRHLFQHSMPIGSLTLSCTIEESMLESTRSNIIYRLINKLTVAKLSLVGTSLGHQCTQASKQTQRRLQLRLFYLLNLSINPMQGQLSKTVALRKMKTINLTVSTALKLIRFTLLNWKV